MNNELTNSRVAEVLGSGLVRVSKDFFFATIGKLDVHPCLFNSPRYDDVIGYVSEWKTPRGLIVGKSVGGTPSLPTQYAISKTFEVKP